MQCDCGCYGEVTFCRICKKHVLTQEERWRCKVFSGCPHNEGYAKKNRFQYLTSDGNYRVRDDERDISYRFTDGFVKDDALLSIINQLAFELDILKRELVKETE
jgi:hypothetical protein